VATDAGSAAGVAWYGVAISIALLVVGLGVGVDAPVLAAVAVLGALLLLRRDARLVVAPLYGAGLVMLLELVRTCRELGHIELVADGTVRARLTTVLAVAGVGAGAAGVTALAVTGAPDRSVIATAAGTLAVILMFAGIVRLARRHRVG
jgi:hypothetical protein